MKGAVTPDTLGMIVAMIGMVLIGLLTFIKSTNEFAENFVAGSSKVIAMDIASLMSLSMSTKETRIEYEIPTETVRFKVDIKNNYVSVQRIDDSYCKEEKKSMLKRAIKGESTEKSRFCQAKFPVLYTFSVGDNVGNKFIIEKIDDKADFYAE